MADLCRWNSYLAMISGISSSATSSRIPNWPPHPSSKPRAQKKTRPNLKVQDGCNNRCSFCIIPFVRGKSRSLKFDQVLCRVDELVARGYREIVFSGINLGRWGRDLTPRTNCASNVAGDSAETRVEKIRISSVEPMDWSDELIELAASSPRICKHAHVPLQSGSDRILRQMHRRTVPGITPIAS